MDQENPKVRLDKYLWACRFYKTRNLSRQMIEGGKVDYNGVRAKASKIVELDARIRLPFGRDKIEIVVKKLSDVRGPYSEAAKLYEETEQSVAERERLRNLQKDMRSLIIPGDAKPNKKQRRDLQKFRDINNI